MAPRSASATIAALAFVAGASLLSVACDKIPGLGKKDGDGGSASSSGGGGGVLSFLGGTFEGEITMSVQGKGQPAKPMVFGIKKPKVRIDAVGGVPGAPNAAAAGPGMAIIADPPAKKAYVLMSAQKTAMVIDFEKAKAMRSAGQPGKPGGGAVLTEVPKIEKTGKKAIIAGYECEEWKVTAKTSRADMCVADGISWVDLTDLGMASPEVGLAVAASEANRFPLRVVAFDAQNVETTRMEAMKIEKKALDESRFVVPADFKIIDMSAVMNGLPGLGGAPGSPGAPGLPAGFIPPKPTR